MTREKAIEWFEFLKKGFVNTEYEEYLNLAITALSAEPCDDCISRKAVLELAVPVGTMYADMTEEMISADDVRKLPSVQPKKGEWILVSERLPDNNVRVLCSAISTSISGGYARFVGCCNNGFWFVQTDAETVSYPRPYKVTAWMPLPEPYKAESEDKE